MRTLILDCETTGFNRGREKSVSLGHRVVELCVIEVDFKTMTIVDRFHVYVNPRRSIDHAAVRVHGITDVFLEGKPDFCDIAEAFISFITGANIVIHNAAFDISFLDQEFQLLPVERRPVGVFYFTDTLVICRNLFPGARNDLESLCARFHVRGRGGGLHGALVDVMCLFSVYSELLLLTRSRSSHF